MHILLLTLYFTPDTAANSIIVTELAEELAKAGHKITVVSAFPHYDTNRIWDQYRGKLVQADWHGNIRVYRTFLYVPKNKSGIFGRVLNYVSFNILSTIVGYFAGRPDLILAPSPPLTIGLSAWLISRLRGGVPFVYNVQDIYPDIAVRLGVLTNQTAIRFFERLEKFVYRKARAISVLSEGFRDNLLNKGVPSGKIHLIPNFVDVDFVQPLPRLNPFSTRTNLNDKFVVMYAGNIGLSQGLESLLAAANLLKDLDDLVVLIVGNGAAKPKLLEISSQLKLTNTVFLPFQPRADLPEIYATADVSLVIIKHGITKESVPSKTYTILASSRPIVAAVDSDSETSRLVEQVNCGLCVEPEDPAALAGAIRQLYANRENIASLGQNGRNYVVANFTKQRVASLYQDLFLKILEQK